MVARQGLADALAPQGAPVEPNQHQVDAQLVDEAQPALPDPPHSAPVLAALVVVALASH